MTYNLWRYKNIPPRIATTATTPTTVPATIAGVFVEPLDDDGETTI